MQDPLSIIADLYMDDVPFDVFGEEGTHPSTKKLTSSRRLERRKTQQTLINDTDNLFPEDASISDMTHCLETIGAISYFVNQQSENRLGNFKSIVERFISPLSTEEIRIVLGGILDEREAADSLGRNMQCYSYGCMDGKCYSVCCPSKSSEGLVCYSSKDEADTWSEYVPKFIQVTSDETRRQEKIYEFIQTEKQYVSDIQNVVELYLEPLEESDIVSEGWTEKVFGNIKELCILHEWFLRELLNRQRESYIVDWVGDVIQSFSYKLEPYTLYGGQQPLSNSLLGKERKMNQQLADFLQRNQNEAIFRKLSLDSFLASPITRLGRYPLLIGDILKHTDSESPDAFYLEVALKKIYSVLAEANEQAGDTSNSILLEEFRDKIIVPEEHEKFVQFHHEQRRVIRHGELTMKKLSDIEVHLFLFDHVLLITKKTERGHELLKKPIPLELIHAEIDSSTIPQNISLLIPNKKLAFHILLPSQLGTGYTFLAKTESHATTWVNELNKQKKNLVENPKYFKLDPLFTFPFKVKVNFIEHYDNEMFLATEQGLYVSFHVSSTDASSVLYSKVLGYQQIHKVAIVPEFDRVYALVDRTLLCYSLKDMIRKSHRDPTVSLKGEKVYSNVKDFTIMVIHDNDGSSFHVLCTLKSSNFNSTLKVEAIDPEIVKDGLIHLFKKFNRSFKTEEFSFKFAGQGLHVVGSRIFVTLSKSFQVVVVKFDQVTLQRNNDLT
jgi:hypothetical protein